MAGGFLFFSSPGKKTPKFQKKHGFYCFFIYLFKESHVFVLFKKKTKKTGKKANPSFPSTTWTPPPISEALRGPQFFQGVPWAVEVYSVLPESLGAPPGQSDGPLGGSADSAYRQLDNCTDSSLSFGMGAPSPSILSPGNCRPLRPLVHRMDFFASPNQPQMDPQVILLINLLMIFWG